MAPFGELGPLDVQVLKKDELFERRSGLLTTYALKELKDTSFELFEHFMLNIKRRGGAISFKMASEIAGKITADIMDNVYEQVNVEAIGEDTRNLKVASEYCSRLDRRFQNIKMRGIESLVHGYVSHDFVIDFEDAQTLFKRVERPTASLQRMLSSNLDDMVVPRKSAFVKMLTDQNTNMSVDEPDAEHELEIDGVREGGSFDGKPKAPIDGADTSST
jgi:hypothetical protein